MTQSLKMLLKLQHLDTSSSFHSFTSTKITNFSINSSVSLVSVKKNHEGNSEAHHLQHQQILVQTLAIIDKEIGRKSCVIKNPDKKSGKDKNFGVNVFHNSPDSAPHDGKCGVFWSQSCHVKIPDAEEEKYENFGALPNNLNELISLNGQNREFVHNVNCSADKNGHFVGNCLPVGRNAPVVKIWRSRNSPARKGKARHEFDEECNTGRITRNKFLPKQMNARCSMKCLPYGGRIPAILDALEGVSNLDKTFVPWEKSLTKKEMSIILKEQVRWERAVEIFDWFKRKCCFEVNAIHYNILFRILGEARRWCEVEKLWDEMGERRIQPINSTYGTLIDVYRKGGLIERAVKWLEMMTCQGIEPDEVTVGIVVQMYKKLGDFKKAEEFFVKWLSGKCMEEEQVNANLGGGKQSKTETKRCPHLSLYTYNNLIDTYGKAGQVEEAYKTFEQMIREGIMPTTVTFNIMIHMCGNHGQLDKVISLIKQMKDFQCSPNTRTYNILIHLHAKHDDITTAAKYFKEMKAASLDPDIVCYRTLLYAFSLRHMVGEAEELILEMNEKGFEIDEFIQSALTRMYIEAGMLESAWSWFQRFYLRGNMTSQCYSATIDAFGEHGHVMEAEMVFNCCRERNKLSILECNVMIKAYRISKKYDEACWLFDLMEQYGIVPDRCSYNTLIQTLAGAEMPHLAKKYVRKMQQAGLVDDCIPYCAVISSFVKLGKLEEAMELYEELAKFGIFPDVVVYGVLIKAFADAGSIKDVTRCLDSMKSAGIPVNAVICRSLIKLYTDVGCVEEAQKTYMLFQSFAKGLDTYSSNCMINLYSRLSLIRQAEVIFQKLERQKQANEFSYAMMLCMYKRNGRFAEAIRIARKMKELGLLTDLLSYNNVLSLYASDGRLREAAEIFTDMLVSAVQPDNSTFKALGVILLKCGFSREDIAKLELLRKDDAEGRLQKWKAAVSSVIKT